MDPRWMRETPIVDVLTIEENHPNHRRGARRRAELPCRIVSHYWDEAVPHHITEVSPSGVWIDTLYPLHPGAEVVICFTPPGGHELTVFARVSRVVTGRRRGDRAPLGMAVEFTDITDAEMQTLSAAA